jgi:hypothetical protein
MPLIPRGVFIQLGNLPQPGGKVAWTDDSHEDLVSASSASESRERCRSTAIRLLVAVVVRIRQDVVGIGDPGLTPSPGDGVGMGDLL